MPETPALEQQNYRGYTFKPTRTNTYAIYYGALFIDYAPDLTLAQAIVDDWQTAR